MNGGWTDTDTVHGEVLQIREQADEAGKLFDAGFRVSQGEGQDGGLKDIAMLVQPEKRRPDVEVPDFEFLKARERVQALQCRGHQEVCLIELSNGNHLADKIEHSHVLKVINSPKPRTVRDREGSMEVGPSRDTPCAGEIGAGEEGRTVRDVVDDIVNEFLGKPRVAYFADPESSFPVEALACKPKRVSRLFGVCVAPLVKNNGHRPK